MQFTNREIELKKIKNILTLHQYTKSLYFELIGASGVGKTELIRKAVDDLYSSERLYIYFDVTQDEFQAASFFGSLIETVYLPLVHRYRTITSIPSQFSLSKYIKKIIRKYKGFESILQALALSAASVPYIGEPLSAISEKVNADSFYSTENFLFTYFKYINKKTRINLIIDNYQFLPDNIKRVFEAGINQFNTGFTLVVINRTENSIDKTETFCNAYTYDSLRIDYMSYDQCKILIENQNIDIASENIQKIWDVTHGNLKDIEIILNDIRINPGYDIIDSNIAIKNLDSIQRSILIITALFPAGMREGYLIYFVRNILNESEENKIKNAISNLINLGYIYKNSITHDTIKPTHETVINHVKQTLDTFDFLHFQTILSNHLEIVALNSHGTKDYGYLLHCWIGINNVETLRQKTSLIQDLITIKYKENAYYYIDSISQALMDIIFYLPKNCIHKILVSFQRVSDFQKGIDLLASLRIKDFNLYSSFRIFYVKFLIQTYEFEDALKELNLLPDSTEKLLCQTNALQHLGKDEQVISLLKSKLDFCLHDENYYVILRNTAHLFDFYAAEKNLLAAYDYFSEQQYSIFVLATVKNNLAVINLWTKNFKKASDYLADAIKSLSSIRSNEIFEPYCNKSIIHLMKKDYSDSIKYAKKALDNCPKLLTLDIVMLNINYTIISLCARKISLQEAYETLVKLQQQYTLIDDPWYEFQLLYNIKQFAELLNETYQPLSKKHLRYESEYTNSLTKFYLLENFKFDNFIVTLCVGLSPNWRY